MKLKLLNLQSRLRLERNVVYRKNVSNVQNGVKIIITTESAESS